MGVQPQRGPKLPALLQGTMSQFGGRIDALVSNAAVNPGAHACACWVHGPWALKQQSGPGLLLLLLRALSLRGGESVQHTGLSRTYLQTSGTRSSTRT
jgi:hypothetical protein